MICSRRRDADAWGQQIIDILDADESVDADRLSLVGVRKQLLNLERAINKNRELRIKYGSDPSKWVEIDMSRR